MLRGRDPVLHGAGELVRGHPGMGRGHDLEHAFLPGRGDALHVALEQRGERLLGLPLGVLRRQRLHAIEREQELKRHRLLGPERAVVVERRDAFGHGHEVGAALLGDPGHEIRDCLFCRSLVPGGQRVVGVAAAGGAGRLGGAEPPQAAVNIGTSRKPRFENAIIKVLSECYQETARLLKVLMSGGPPSIVLVLTTVQFCFIAAPATSRRRRRSRTPAPRSSGQA